MRLQDNASDGNCLFQAVADVLQDQGRTKRTASEMRTLAVTHLRRHQRSFQGFWRGDAPDANGSCIASQGFGEYLTRLAQPGAWGGSLELSALANTLDQPIFICRPDDDGLRVFNPAGKGRAICLWFEKRHYQAVVGGPVPKQDIADAKPAVIGLAADRGGGPSSCAASSLGGRTGGGAASKLGGMTPGSCAGLSKLGGQTASKAPSTLGGRSAAGPSVGHGRGPDFGDFTGETVEAVEPPPVPAMQRPARASSVKWRKQSPFVFGDKVFFKCEFCPFQIECSTRSIASGVRNRHCTNHHGGRGLPGALRVDTSSFCKIKAGTATDWMCPCCRYGLPEGAKAALSKSAFQAGVKRHRQAAHPGVPIKEWKSRNIAVNVGKPAKRRLANQRLRVTILSKGPPKVPVGAFDVFRWPQIHPRRWQLQGRKCKRLVLRLTHAFRCKGCLCSFGTALSANRHNCRGADERVRVTTKRHLRRLKIEERRSAKLSHGFTSAEHAKLFSIAREFISGGGAAKLPAIINLFCEMGAHVMVPDPARATAVAFEFTCQGAPSKVLFVSLYGHAWDKQLATDHAFAVASACTACATNWLALGDFNVEEEEMATRLVGAQHRSLDEPFLCEGPLPPTSAGGRRIDFGWGSWSMPAIELPSAPGVADHTAVMYGFDLGLHSGCLGPPRVRCGDLLEAEVSKEAWCAVWEEH
ncbi:otud6b, partial [Symbiodinium sp. CCMP2456]